MLLFVCIYTCQSFSSIVFFFLYDDCLSATVCVFIVARRYVLPLTRSKTQQEIELFFFLLHYIGKLFFSFFLFLFLRALPFFLLLYNYTTYVSSYSVANQPSIRRPYNMSYYSRNCFRRDLKILSSSYQLANA